jgi:hypothetical protein
MTPRPPKFNIAEELAKAVQAVKGSEAKPNANVAPAPAAPVAPERRNLSKVYKVDRFPVTPTPAPVALAVPDKPTIDMSTLAKPAKRATLAIVEPDRTCRQCQGPIDGKEILVTIGNRDPDWLHPECRPFHLRDLEEKRPAGNPPTATSVPADLNPLATAARWRECFSRLSPLDAPRGCRGFPDDTWRHCCREILAFLDETRSPYWARIAAECGWDDIGLFGVHPVVGLARFDTAGALLTNLRGEPITQVLPGLIRFRSGVAAYRVPTNPATIPIWDFEELPLS